MTDDRIERRPVDEERLAKLRALFPEVFTDGQVDVDRLRALLGDAAAPEPAPGDEHYGLRWPGKAAARKQSGLPPTGTLRPAPGEGLEEDTTENLLLVGDNLEVLRLLQKSYAGKVKLIYIDPPYNTGNDFVYKDDFKEPVEAYLEATGQADLSGLVVSNPESSGRYHSNWLSMLYPRLAVARTLLTEEGVIFVSIDDHEVHNLRLAMDELFGAENFIATVIWQKVYSPKNSARHFSEDHDYVVVYALNGEAWTPELLPRTAAQDAAYTNPDNDPRRRRPDAQPGRALGVESPDGLLRAAEQEALAVQHGGGRVGRQGAFQAAGSKKTSTDSQRTSGSRPRASIRVQPAKPSGDTAPIPRQSA